LHQLLGKVNEMNLNELTIRRNDLTLTLKTGGIHTQTPARAEPNSAEPAVAVPIPPPAPTPAPDEKANPAALTINAPLSGTFYISSGPGKPPFAKEGDLIKSGQPVCIVEAMKLLNQIKAPCDCKIIKYILATGTPVKKDDPLVAIEKA